MQSRGPLFSYNTLTRKSFQGMGEDDLPNGFFDKLPKHCGKWFVGRRNVQQKWQTSSLLLTLESARTTFARRYRQFSKFCESTVVVLTTTVFLIFNFEIAQQQKLTFSQRIRDVFFLYGNMPSCSFEKSNYFEQRDLVRKGAESEVEQNNLRSMKSMKSPTRGT